VKDMFFGLGVLALVIIFILGVVAIYNSLVRLRNRVKNAWSQIDVQLKRRHDLIPNLVEVAKGYMAHERQTLENVIKARTQAVQATSIKDKAQAENFLTSTLRSLFAVVENYPNLKADSQMLSLQEELTNTENRISFARQYYNDEVTRFNTKLETFPSNLIAGWFGFQKEELFELEERAQKEPPQVKF